MLSGAPRSLAALLALLTVLASCTPSKPKANETPRSGGILTVAIRDLGSLDPAKAAARGALIVVAQVFDPLTSIDPSTDTVVPAAAASWKTSRNGLHWYFRIAKATYHDGKRVRSGDFKRAFDRIARKATRADAAFQLQQVHGFRAAHITGKAKTLTGVRSLKGNVLRVDLDRPFAELPYFLAHPALAPLPARYARSTKGLDTKPVGNGPFRVTKASAQNGATLARFEAYHGAKPYLDGIEFTVRRKLEDGWQSFLDHRVDVADVPAAAAEARREVVGEGGFTPYWATLAFGPNLKLAKYAKPEVRRALALALDRDAIASTVYGNTKDAATGIVPRGVRGYVPDACGACVLDRPRAEQIIGAAFPKKKPQIVIDHLDDATSRRLAAAIASDLKAVGFRTKLRRHTATGYLKLLRAGKQDFAQLGWLTVVPSPDGFLAEQLRTGSPNNQTAFKDRKFDGIVDRARRERNDAKRLALYRAAEARALELMPMIPVVFFRNRTAVADRVRAFTLDGAGVFDGSKVWIASR